MTDKSTARFLQPRWLLMIVLWGMGGGMRSANATEVVLFKPFDAVSIHSPTIPVPPPGPVAYTASGPAASWGVVAWDIPGGNLSPFLATRDKLGTISTSQAAEASVKVAHTRAGDTAIWLSQDGMILPCLSSTGQPRESDLFLSPNNTAGNLDVSGFATTVHSYPLQALRHLNAIVTISYSAGPSLKRQICGVAQGNVMIAAVLNDRVRHETLFYQLSLAVVCGPQPAQRLAFCQRQQSMPRSNFFFTRNPFGVDDRLPLLGQAFLIPHETRTVHVDLLPRLLGFLRVGPLSMDRDPDHWALDGFYAGQNIWGGMKLATRWSMIQLIADVDH